MGFKERFKGWRWRSLLLAVLALAALVALVVLYGVMDPSTSVLYPKCVFYMLTGLECPGCGSQRALHSLLNADVAGALHHNLLLLPAMIYVLTYFILVATRSFRSIDHVRVEGVINRLYRGKAVIVVLVVVLLFWILRNFTPDW